VSEKSIIEIAEEFGLTVETVAMPEGDNAYKVLKGLNTVVVGNDAAVRRFLSTYEADRPAMLDGSMYGYKE
jgi:hypothetical protein